MKYIKINKKNILFVLLLLLPERLFFLVNQSQFFGIIHKTYMDTIMILYFIIAVVLFIHFRTKSFEKYYFNINIIQIVPLVIIAAVVPKFLFNQGINGGLWIQKNFYMMIFSYYIFRTFIVEKVITVDYLWKLLYKLSFIMTGVIILQHAICNYIRILSVNYSSRFGVRITDNYTYSTVLLVGSLTLFFSTASRRDKIVSLIGLIMAYYHCVIVSQTRIVMIGYGVVTIVIALFYRNRMIKKITFIFILLGLLLILLQSNLGQYLYTAMIDSSTDPSAQIRDIGRLYYISEISKSPLFGKGYPGNEAAFIAEGLYENIFLNDNGLIGFTYIYGLVGLGWYLWLTLKMFYCSVKAVKVGDFRFLLYTLFLQVISPNIIWWYWKFSFGIIFAIMLALMEEYQTKISEPKIKLYFGGLL